MVNDQLRVDFSTSRGHEMIIDRESGILRDELDEVEIQMLQAQRIPKLLPIDWVDIDGRVTFRYALSGRRMLIHRLQTQQLSMIEFYSMLLSIAEALDESQHYMLRTEGFMLNENYLFVGESWTDIALVYVPLRGSKSAASPGESVLAMAVHWLSYVNEPDGLGFQRIVRYLRGESISWGSLRQAIISLLGAIHSTGLEQVKKEHGAANTPLFQEAISQPIRRNVVIEKKLPKVSGPPLSAPLKWSVEEELPFNEVEKDNEGQNRSRQGWILGTGFIVTSALIWRFLYLASPNQTSLLISCGLTLLCAAGLLIYWRRKTEGGEDPIESWHQVPKWIDDEDGFVPDSTPLSVIGVTPAQPKQGIFRTDNRFQEYGVGRNGEFASIENVEDGANTPKQKNVAQTSKVPVNDATVLLGQEKSSMKNDAGTPAYWLDRDAEGIKEQIALQTESFVIGRSAEGVNYVDSTSGISRAHLEITGSQGIWSAKDVGSRNGSTWNGQMMIPYKAYTLTSGDCIQLAGEKGPKYIYRTL
jgi:hypothetical protein